MNIYYYITYIFFFYLKFVFGTVDIDPGTEIHLYHNLEPTFEPEWEECGYLLLQNANTGQVVFRQRPLTSDVLTRFENLVSKKFLYRIKAVVKTAKGKITEFYTFADTKTLFDSELYLRLKIFLDPTGAVIGFTAIPAASFPSDEPRKPIIGSFSFEYAEKGPIPDTATYIQKLEREREAKQAGNVPDNRSFLAKYWMYLLPIVLFAVLSGTSNPEGGGQNAR